jgi:hypothetical protein
MDCPHCKIPLTKGIAIQTRTISHFEDEFGNKARSCFYAQGRPRLVPCLKCPRCGHSDDEQKSEIYEVGMTSPFMDNTMFNDLAQEWENQANA